MAQLAKWEEDEFIHQLTHKKNWVGMDYYNDLRCVTIKSIKINKNDIRKSEIICSRKIREWNRTSDVNASKHNYEQKLDLDYIITLYLKGGVRSTYITNMSKIKEIYDYIKDYVGMSYEELYKINKQKCYTIEKTSISRDGKKAYFVVNGKTYDVVQYFGDTNNNTGREIIGYCTNMSKLKPLVEWYNKRVDEYEEKVRSSYLNVRKEIKLLHYIKAHLYKNQISTGCCTDTAVITIIDNIKVNSGFFFWSKPYYTKDGRLIHQMLLFNLTKDDKGNFKYKLSIIEKNKGSREVINTKSKVWTYDELKQQKDDVVDRIVKWYKNTEGLNWKRRSYE